MRGKPVVEHGRAERDRIIPAHAGQTDRSSSGWRYRSDHPRTCGANVSTTAMGSSRGRIIPAHAGQTTRWSRRSRGRPDHPRTCGANFVPTHCAHVRHGSSPHMRGKLADALSPVLKVRIIPAHAGQTFQMPLTALPAPDHPRTCGANASPSFARWSSAGSSPHMRGKPVDAVVDRIHRRIIPAHAGQTYSSSTSRRRRTDHPRTCGANTLRDVCRVADIGSSPHMRGKLERSDHVHERARIIPAHAGQT